MRVALFTTHNDATAGGGFYFEQAVLQAVANGDIPFEVVNVHRGKDVRSSLPTERIPIPSNPTSGNRDFRQALTRVGAEYVWFVGSYEPSDWPYTFTVLDLAHRRFPDFPETSVFGWRYEEREKFYTTAIGRASAVIVGTDAGKIEVSQYYSKPVESVHVIPFFCPPFANPSQAVDVGSKDFFFYPAQMWPHKNHVVLLDAMVEIVREKPHVSLVLVGSDQGNMKFVLEQIKIRSLNKNVHVLGFVPRSELRWLYENARALVFPTFFGPDNLPPLEAFSLGCPVIASQIHGASDQLGDAAYYCDPEDANSWTCAMKQILEDEELRQSLAAKGKEQQRDRTDTGYVHKMVEVLHAVSHRRRCWGVQSEFVSHPK